MFHQGNCVSHLVATNPTNILSKAMSGQGDNLNVNYDELLKAQKDESVLIIDVREDSEIQETGKLPGSIHIPSIYFITEEYFFSTNILHFLSKMIHNLFIFSG